MKQRLLKELMVPKEGENEGKEQGKEELRRVGFTHTKYYI